MKKHFPAKTILNFVRLACLAFGVFSLIVNQFLFLLGSNNLLSAKYDTQFYRLVLDIIILTLQFSL